MEWPSCANNCGFEGVIFVCSEGWFCEQCYSTLAGVPVAEAFEMVDDPDARQRLRDARGDRTLDVPADRVENQNRSG